MFIFLSHHESSNVLQKDNWNPVSIAYLHELSAFIGTVGKQNAIVAYYPHFPPVKIGKSANDRSTVLGLEFVKTAAIHHACYHFNHVELFFNIIRNDTV